jgi:Activator of Hsp90 ATPase homolog 1-like protein
MPNTSYIIASIILEIPIEKVWNFWTKPEHIRHWHLASDEWKIIKASNDLQVFGQFKLSFTSNDGSYGHDMTGTYSIVEKHKKIKYFNDLGKTITVDFIIKQNSDLSNQPSTQIIQSIETSSPHEMLNLQVSHQAILNNFKAYCLSNCSRQL